MPSRTAIPAIQGYEDIFNPTTPGTGQMVAQVVEMPLEQMYSFDGYCFQVRDDALMRETARSIDEHGVLVPGLVRPRVGGGFEIIAGHRRKYGCELAGLRTMPVIIRDLDDVEATLIMVDSNLQREYLLPSEKAWAFRMKLQALNHRGRKVVEIPIGKLSVDMLAEEYKGKRGFSKTNIYRFVRLTELVPTLIDLVDAGKIAVEPASVLSYLTRVQQAQLVDWMAKYDAIPSPSQAKRLKELKESKLGWCEVTAEKIVAEEKKSEVKVTLTANKLVEYFPKGYSKEQIEDVIFSLLDDWKNSQPIVAIAG